MPSTNAVRRDRPAPRGIVRTADRSRLSDSPHISPWVLLVVLMALFGAGISLALGDPAPVAIAAAVTWLAMPAMALPFAMRRGVSAVANPWTVIFGLFVYSWAIRLTVTAVSGPGSDAYEKMFFGSHPQIIFDGLLLGGVGMAAFSAGYMITSSRTTQMRATQRFQRWYRLDDQNSWSPRLMEFFGLGVFLFAMVGFLLLQRSTGDAGSLAAKRFNDLVGGGASRTSSIEYVYLRMAYLSHAVFIVLLVYRLKFRRLPSPLLRVLLPVTGLVAVAVPFLGNNRAGVALVLVDLLMLQVLLSGRIRAGRLAIGAVFATALLGWMFALRSATTQGLREGIVSTFSGRDLFDIGKLAHIQQAPAELNGETLWGWLFFAVPERLLPFEKPLWTGLGQYVFNEVYRGPGDITGIPAGLIGELYLSFGWVCVVVGMALFGVLVAAIYRVIKPLVAEGKVIGAVLFRHRTRAPDHVRSLQRLRHWCSFQSQ